LRNHVVIAGGGQIGQNVANILRRLELSFVVIELDYRTVETLKPTGCPIIYGDASKPVVLNAAQIRNAELIIIAMHSAVLIHSIIEQVKVIKPNLHIVTTAINVDHMQELQREGVFEVVQPEMEASLEITRQALIHLNVSAEKIHRFTDSIRTELYKPLYDNKLPYQTLSRLKSAAQALELSWINVSSKSPLVDHSIQHLRIRSKSGVSVVAVIRDGEVYSNPDPAFSFKENDLVGVLNTSTQLERFKMLFKLE
jgi:CPA2 family monovalent cation:H+ antiporter-2